MFYSFQNYLSCPAVAPQAAHPPAVHSSAPTHSQYQPPSTVSTHYQQPSNPYPNQYSTQPYSQHGAVQGQPPQPMQTQPTSHSQGPRPLMEQQHPASYRVSLNEIVRRLEACAFVALVLALVPDQTFPIDLKFFPWCCPLQ